MHHVSNTLKFVPSNIKVGNLCFIRYKQNKRKDVPVNLLAP